MAYITGPYGAIAGTVVTPPTMTARAKLHSSRKIDPRTMRYVNADDGGFEPMDDVAQRVLLLLAFVVQPNGRIDPKQANKTKQDIRNALAPLTAQPEPAIRIDKIEVTDDGRVTSNVFVGYTNLLTNTQTTVTP